MPVIFTFLQTNYFINLHPTQFFTLLLWNDLPDEKLDPVTMACIPLAFAGHSPLLVPLMRLEEPADRSPLCEEEDMSG